ncbi:DUF2332 domain-containing protein [Lysinibacillus sp. NPDC097287]|uniref:DUF2332 domain-containing protein n=1 Tax=Lysinibacillus sp. NPDC097287 TaxID=3364144 RepID=UPI003817B3B2
MLIRETLSTTFTNFAENECKGSSVLYEHFALEISKDNELLDLCTNARKGQPVPNLLFGAVHFLLLKGSEHILKEFYPSLVSNPKPPSESYEYFKDFCLLNIKEIIQILQTKLVQTNEVRRCAYLYPVFSFIYEKTKKPLALIEIGTSAGLQLLWDKYSYTINNKDLVGNLDSTLQISTVCIGDELPFLKPTSPPVSTRIGIDLNIVDLTNEEELLWLKALIWPEHKERLILLEQAANYVIDASIQFVEGDGVALLNTFVDKIAMDQTICIYHTHVANQMPIETRKSLLDIIESIGKNKDVFHIYNNIQDKYLHLDYYINGLEHTQTIAETDGHGRWFKWLVKNELGLQ